MTLIALSEAKARILKDVTPLKQVMAPLEKARGRVLASDLEALHNQPPFDSSSMDGYAVRAADIKTLPASLKVIGESAAGQVFNGTLTAGTAVRIFTGAQVPQGADTVIMQENTR
ncbi:MAG TPA: molybdopterin molybdenumtransferase MoeA, partial [Rhizobiales bacterium]|nr:molybdopterin molybdenumtransferase MoeA [Hyphomicrobiales bacterium]